MYFLNCVEPEIQASLMGLKIILLIDGVGAQVKENCENAIKWARSGFCQWRFGKWIDKNRVAPWGGHSSETNSLAKEV